MDDAGRAALMELERKLSRACQIGRGVTLTAAQVNAFVAVGGLKVISEAALAGLIDLARQRTGGVMPVQQEAPPAARTIARVAENIAAPSRPHLNDIEHRAAERQAMQAAEAVRRKRNMRPPSS